uniref:Gypsy retrotransposon integrase-like protein 1 n=1 Tax=Astyanax mexicanus TaxID=7994 RepID=A0A8B9J7P3_ASTMX
MSRRPSSQMVTKAVQCVLTTPAAGERLTPRGDKEVDKPIPDSFPTLSIDPNEMRKRQEADDSLGTVRAWMEVVRRRPQLGSLKGLSPAVRKLWHEFPKLSLRNGILCRKYKSSPHTLPVYQVVLPEVLIPTALKALHGNEFSGHLGADRTLQRARRICYWPYMSHDIHKFCLECLPCQSRSSPTPHERAPLQCIHATRPFQRIAADITKLPITSRGHRYVLVIIDYFTRYVNHFPLKDQRAVTVAQCIFEEYIRQHGIPEAIHTDQGRQFDSDLMKQLCSMLRIEKTRTSPYHAQSDGMVERLNRTLKDQLAKYMLQSGGEWDCYLSQFELAYNSSVHSSTGFSPFFLAHGREPHLP